MSPKDNGEAHAKAKAEAQAEAKAIREDFPLWIAGNGCWAKKVGGVTKYFGKMSDPQAAFDKYEEFLQGDVTDSHRVKDLLNGFLDHRQRLLDRGAITSRTYGAYQVITDLISTSLGKNTPLESLTGKQFEKLSNDLAKSNKRRGATGVSGTTLKFRLTVACMTLKRASRLKNAAGIPYALDYSEELKKPSALSLRRERNARPPRLFKPDQVRAIIEAADPIMCRRHTWESTLLSV